MSYQWQIRRGLLWKDLPSNQEIERDYCNPANTQHTGSSPIDFDTMTCGLDKVRRVSKATQWVWYWEEKEAEGIWRAYEICGDLERRYHSGKQTVKLALDLFEYELSFADMVQRNLTTHKVRRVRRRPMFQNATEKLGRNGTPLYWDSKLLPSVGYERIHLKTSSSEYSAILSLFNRTMSGWNILSIERIQNLLLWNFFKLQRDNMKAKNCKDVDERLLFYGTGSQHVDAICRDNIDWRVSGRNGAYYGQGSYFARDAVYSNDYTDSLGTKSVFVCRALVGDFTKGERHYKRPPLKVQWKGIAFDSCVNQVNNPCTFVIFEKNQIYPEYLIQYEGGVDELVVSSQGASGHSVQPSPYPPLPPAPPPPPPPPPASTGCS